MEAGWTWTASSLFFLSKVVLYMYRVCRLFALSLPDALAGDMPIQLDDLEALRQVYLENNDKLRGRCHKPSRRH